MPLYTEKVVHWPAAKPYDKQAIVVPGTKRPGQTGKQFQYPARILKFQLDALSALPQ